MTRRPPRSSAGSRNDGMLPRMITRIVGKSRTKNAEIGSRRNSLISVRVSLAKTLMDLLLHGPAGQLDERVVQAGLLDPQVGGDDLVDGEHGGDGVQQVAGADDLDLAAVP